MYTRCPSCKSEICFEPPTNLDSLPEGYKHRIKCPNCGVTIGVKLPRMDSFIEPQSTYRPANQNATSFEPILQAGDGLAAESATHSCVKVSKKTGRIRNGFIFFFSLLLTAIFVFSYILYKGMIPALENLRPIADMYTVHGIAGWEALITDFSAFKILFVAKDFLGYSILMVIVPMCIFVLAAISTTVSFACFIAKKYSRVLNLIMCLTIGTLSLCMFFAPFILGVEMSLFIEYFVSTLVDGSQYLILAEVGISILLVLFSLFFLGSMKKKQKN